MYCKTYSRLVQFLKGRSNKNLEKANLDIVNYALTASYLNHTILLQPSANHTSFQLTDIHPKPDATLRDSLRTTG